MRSINLTEINNTVQQLNGIIWENLGDNHVQDVSAR